jgi:DHA1 family multidrug resistance protein-like MFS transporter
MIAIKKIDWAFNGLLACCFLFVFTETMLAPDYPQFFRLAFGNEKIAMTGEAITLCRVIVLVFAPLWGWVARFISPIKLLIWTQLSTAIFTALCAFTTNADQFFIFSALLLIGKSSYILFYTLLINLRPQQKASTVAKTQASFHIAIIASTLMSTWAIQWPQVLQIFYLLAGLDIVQVIFCLLLINKVSKRISIPAPNTSSFFTLWHPRYINFMLVIFLLHFSINIIRPYFTTFMSATLDMQADFLSMSTTYLLPSVIALFSIPFIKYYRNERFFTFIFSFSVVMLGLSFLVQAFSHQYWELFIARSLFGAFSILCLASIDYFIFQNSDHTQVSSNYTTSVAIQNAALLSAPFIAGLVVQSSFIWPFYIAAAGTFLIFVIVQATVQRKYYFHPRISAKGIIS